jgi:hypothetical protein
MAAFGPDKDSDGKILTTHSDTGNFATNESPTADNRRYVDTPRLNRAQRRAMEKIVNSKKPGRLKMKLYEKVKNGRNR